VADRVGQEAAAGACERGADEQVADAQGEFALGVEEGEVDGHAGEEATFDSAEEETAYDEAGVGLDDAGEGRDDAPGCGDEGDPAAGAELFEDEVGGEF